MNIESDDFLKVIHDHLIKQVVTEPIMGANIFDSVLNNNEHMIREVLENNCAL